MKKSEETPEGMEKTRVLITGSNGQVGSSLVSLLKVRKDIELLAVDRNELDITNEVTVNKCVSSFKPEFIINAAAHTAVDKAESEVELSYAINEKGPRFLAKAADVVDASILHISTDYVFDGNKDGIYSEDDTTNPLGVYGASKLAGELAVAKANSKHIILRTAWVFGERGNNFVKTMLRLAKSKNTLSIVGDQFGGPTYAGDIAKTLIKMVDAIKANQQVEFGVYHYSGLPHVSWFEFAEQIFINAAQQGIIPNVPTLTSISTEQYPTLAQRPTNSKMDLSRITAGFDIEASNWREAMSDLTLYKG